MKAVQWLLVCILSYGSLLGETHVIEAILPGGNTISESGTYVFAGDLTWDPSSDGAAITIEASDVTLDMMGFTLQSSFSTYKTIGILAEASENLEIKNGTLQNMGLSGVKCVACANVLIKKVTVDGLYVEDVVDYTVPTGILTSECANASIEQCIVKNINVKSGSCAGIQLTATIISKVVNCTV